MATMTMTPTKPRIWVGCLHCYNDGRLIGNWFDCADPDDVEEIDLHAVHAGQGGARVGCEELWIMDCEGFPQPREMDLLEARDWAEVYEQVDDHLWPALCAWVESGSYVTEGHGHLPSIPDFYERYQGEWDDFDEFADHVATEMDIFDHWPDEAKRYFNWKSWTEDLAYDYTIVNAPETGVFVFRNL